VRELLLARVDASLKALDQFARRDAALSQVQSPELGAIAALKQNFATFTAAVTAVKPGAFVGSAAARWHSVLQAFDQFSGNDMRVVLHQAVDRQRRTADLAATALADALARVRFANAPRSRATSTLSSCAKSQDPRRETE
jgi:hypothetical protein